MSLRDSLFVVCLASLSACSSKEETPPVADSSTVDDTAFDTGARDTATEQDSATEQDTASVDSQGPDSAMVDSTSDTMDSTIIDSGADTAETAVTDAGADLGYDPCDIVLPCPAAVSGGSQFCGSVFDLADTTRVNGVTANLKVTVYDALEYATSPTTATPMGSFAVDSCGRFSGAITSSGLGRYLLSVDEAVGATTDAYATAGIVASARDTSGRYTGVRAFAMRKVTDTSWSTGAGLSPSLVTRGAYLGIFIDPYKIPVGPFPGAPVAGVQFTKSDAPVTAKDYYFSDSAALARTAVNSTAAVTGTNGSGILLDASVADGLVYGGTGGLGTGCLWPKQAAQTVAGMVWVQEFVMTSLVGSTCTGAP